MTHAALVRQVRQRMDALGITPYQLHQRLKGKVSKQTVYNFLEHDKAIRSDTLLHILGALDFEIVENPEAGVHEAWRTKPQRD